MSPADLATLALLDPDQGVCPEGHPCRLSNEVDVRECSGGEYRGLSLICWEITSDEIDVAIEQGANGAMTAWAYAFVADRSSTRN
jgi:hypothetical protein